MSPTSRKRKKRRGSQQRRASSPGSAPPQPEFRVRPRWQKATGIGILGLAALVIVVNFGSLLGFDAMPGGHSTLYFVGGLAGVVMGAWLMGAFDG